MIEHKNIPYNRQFMGVLHLKLERDAEGNLVQKSLTAEGPNWKSRAQYRWLLFKAWLCRHGHHNWIGLETMAWCTNGNHWEDEAGPGSY